MSAKQHKQIFAEDKHRLLVFGYIRNYQNSINTSKIIPVPIIHICLSYLYCIGQYFHQISELVKLSNDNHTITKIKDHWNNSSYGDVKIHSQSNSIYEWEVKIDKIDNGGIGISSSDKTENIFWWHENTVCYGYFAINGNKVSGYNQYKKYGKPIHSNDIVSVKLDLKNQQISFSLNYEDQGIAYDNIIKKDNLYYRLVVTLSGKEDQVTIIKFTKTK